MHRRWRCAVPNELVLLDLNVLVQRTRRYTIATAGGDQTDAQH
jgi:hypothetical protein